MLHTTLIGIGNYTIRFYNISASMPDDHEQTHPPHHPPVLVLVEIKGSHP
jgi:hypothetical protein